MNKLNIAQDRVSETILKKLGGKIPPNLQRCNPLFSRIISPITKHFMKIIIFTLFFISTLSYAEDELAWVPPTKAEVEAIDKMFVKIKYILGAVYAVRIKIIINEEGYTNIPDFSKSTKKLKKTIYDLREEYSKEAYGGYLTSALSSALLCIASYNVDTFHCDQSLIILKDYFWEKEFDTNWSGYPTLADWTGFPEHM